MKLEEHFSSLLVCPVEGGRVTSAEQMYRSGVCHRCGHVSGGTVTHATRVSGKWSRPNLLERLRGRKSVFLNAEQLADPKTLRESST